MNKRNTKIKEQREYTKKIIDCVAYCQVGGIGQRGAEESEKFENPGNFRRVVQLLAKHNTEFKAQLHKRSKTRMVITCHTERYGKGDCESGP